MNFDTPRGTRGGRQPGIRMQRWNAVANRGKRSRETDSDSAPREAADGEHTTGWPHVRGGVTRATPPSCG